MKIQSLIVFVIFFLFSNQQPAAGQENNPAMVMQFTNKVNGVELDTFMMLVFENVGDSKSAKQILQICTDIHKEITENGPVLFFDDYQRIISDILPCYKEKIEKSGSTRVLGIFPNLELEFEIFKKKSDTLAWVGTAASRGFLFTKISLPFEYLQKNTLCPTR